jgi:hypothetical protein
MNALSQLPAENAWTIYSTAPMLATRARVSLRERRLSECDCGASTGFKDRVLIVPPYWERGKKQNTPDSKKFPGGGADAG